MYVLYLHFSFLFLMQFNFKNVLWNEGIHVYSFIILHYFIHVLFVFFPSLDNAILTYATYIYNIRNLFYRKYTKIIYTYFAN